jgi:hypothetical protein
VKTKGFDLFSILEGDPIAIEEGLGTPNLEMLQKQSPVAGIDRALNSLAPQA